MIISAKSGLRGMLVNADTGQPIRWGRWANLETGEFEAFRTDPEDAKRRGIPLETILYRGRCHLRFVESYAPPVAPRVAAPDGAGTTAEGAALRQRFRRITERIIAVRGFGCEHPGCGGPGEWLVGDEMLLPPEPDEEGRPCERAMLVNRHRYCSRHYRLPRVIAPNGDTVREVEVLAMPGR